MPSGLKISYFPVILAVLVSIGAASSSAQEQAANLDLFEKTIRPALIEHCFECHSAEAKRLKGGLYLDSKEGLLEGGDSGPAINLAHPSESLLLSALRQEEFEMPPSGKLPKSILESFESWIRQGAHTPASFQSNARPEAKSPPELSKQTPHWAFEPIERPIVPATNFPNWTHNPIDYFVSARLSQHNLQPSQSATDRILARRSTFDTLGLPPEDSEFTDLKSKRPRDWYTAHVDSLLANPHFGEHWGRKWLDLARYADTNGVDENFNYLQAWRYRDYVIRALNQDKPYSQFLTEQIAGDLLPKPRSIEQQRDQVIATGFLTLGPKMLAEQDKDKLLIDIVDEQIDVLAKTTMGLTVGCARCHDHKFDPISARDYYALAGIFRSTQTMSHTNHVSFWTETVLPDRDNAKRRALHQRAVEQLEAEIEALSRAEESDSSASKRKKLKSKLKKLRDQGPDLPKAMSVADGEPHDLPVHIRGSHLNLAKTSVPRGFPQHIASSMRSTPVPNKQSGRLELANWLFAPDHPLTARVIVNRIWQGYFGTALVTTPSNFGLRGSPPSHPKLLDWLAAELIESGWSLKHIHRLILCSATYRQASEIRAYPAEIDPANKLLWRQNTKRMTAEGVRDSILSTGKRLRRQIGGIPDDADRNETYYRGSGKEFNSLRRAVYLPVIRGRGYELFNTFDYSDSGTHLATRTSPIVPHQALFMLNAPLVTDTAEHLAAIYPSAPDLGSQQLIEDLYHRILFRPPNRQERKNAQRFIESLEELSPAHSERSSLGLLIQSLLATNEFIFIE